MIISSLLAAALYYMILIVGLIGVIVFYSIYKRNL